MSWRQDIEDRPRRPRWDLYLDGLVTGGSVTWLIMMLYNHVQREGGGMVGTVGLISVIAFISIVTLIKAWRLKRQD